MNKKLIIVFLGIFVLAIQAVAQQTILTGKVSSIDGTPISGVAVKVKGTSKSTQTNASGGFKIEAQKGDVLMISFIGMITQQITVGDNTSIDVKLKEETTGLNEVVVTALGQKVSKRSLGTSQQSVSGAAIAETQRENFIDALQGRVAGVEVMSTSGVPGASSTITIRGVSSISGSNQPLMIVDGLPIDNKTVNTNVFASNLYNNRGVDFTNRSSDINPNDIESLVVLKGPEAAALYGIDAANGAIVITTKRAKAGVGRINYSYDFRINRVRTKPEVQTTYGLGTNGDGNTSSIVILNGGYEYFGTKYPAGTQFYDNVKDFFRTALTNNHNLSFEGGTEKANYRISTGYVTQQGVVPNTDYNKLNITGVSQGVVNDWLKTDLSMAYSYTTNSQPFKGENGATTGGGGPLLGLLVWPSTDDASNWLTGSGLRRKFNFGGASTEIDNPYFSANKNSVSSKTNRIISNLGLTITPLKWLNVKSNIGIDAYINQNMILQHPESSSAFSKNGVLNIANDITKNINWQNLINLTKQKLTSTISIDATLGNALQDANSRVDAAEGENFLDPNFVSINNTAIKVAKTTISQRRLVSFFGRATLDYKNYLFLTATLRNDRTSTIPIDRYSFWYPSVQGSFVFTDVPLFKPALRNIFSSGKLRAAYANVGKDARPYAYTTALENKTTSGGGYGYGFTGPNPGLKPEFATSVEFGTELGFFKDRLGLDVTFYRKETIDQIVNDLRSSYATGFILLNLNGGQTRNEGLEITLRGIPIVSHNFRWDIITNFESAKSKVLSLPNSIPESYVSDTWLYGNIRNGASPGLSTRALTGLFYLRNNSGQLLINPSTGLPVRSTSFIDAGYDRQPDFSIGITNTFTYKNMSLSFLLDIRKGGDIFNATQHYLTTLGLTKNTLDREQPRIIKGVLQDGKENSATPTANNIAITPYYQNTYYTNMSEELFVEKNINWVRLRDVTFTYKLPEAVLKKQNFVKTASVFVTGTDLFLITNYSGLDPVVNGNSAAVGGSGGSGIDYGNFPIPMGFNFGVKVGF